VQSKKGDTVRIYVLSVFRTPPLITVCFREFGAEQKDLSRIVDPYKNYDERACRAVGRRHVAAPNVQADQMLANRK
jgi:hypothetical protein